MTRIVSLSLLLLASCTGSTCTQATAPVLPVVPEHTHATAGADETCADACGGGVCVHSYDVATQSPGACDAEGPSLCICVAPKE